MKKITLVLSITLLTVVFGIGSYYIWNYYKKSSPSLRNDGQSQNSTTTPTVSINAKTLDDAKILSYFVNNNIIHAIRTTGEVVEINGDVTTVVNTQRLDNLIEATPSHDGAKILAKFGNKSAPLFSIYDVASSSWANISGVTLLDADWARDTQEIAYLERVGGRLNIGTLNTSKTDKSGNFTRKTLGSVLGEDFTITYLNSNEILLSDKPSAKVAGSIWKYKIKEGTLEPLMYEMTGAIVEWDKTSGQGLLFYVNKGNNLALLNANGAPLTNFSLLTMPSKCSFAASSTLYCAIPQSIPSGITLPDDYLKKATFFNDGCYSIDLTSGQTTTLINSVTEFDAEHITRFGNALLFINRKDGRLYKIQP